MSSILKILNEFNKINSAPDINEGVEIIQQWQYDGEVHSRLLDSGAFNYAKKSGITSVQSYVLWSNIEKEEGRLDFSIYDSLVKKLETHGLKWVPFLILGPNYSVPEWFHNSSGSIYAKCIEHGMESRIQSIWNPHLPELVDRFIKTFSDHFDNKNVIESILLGVSGNWGESLYPVSGGFSDFHTHPGWWCGDKYAIKSYRKFLKNKYSSIEKLNHVYSSKFKFFSDIKIPIKKNKIESCMLNHSDLLTKILRRSKKITRELLSYIISLTPHFMRSILAQNVSRSIRHFDFVTWYQQEMTEWSGFWLKTARSHFPENKIYLVTGGDGSPQTGAQFADQVKAAKKYNAGIRTTNQLDEYLSSFIFPRLVSSASRFYNSYYSTEEAWINNAAGVSARIFDAASSGACGGFIVRTLSAQGMINSQIQYFPLEFHPEVLLNLLKI